MAIPGTSWTSFSCPEDCFFGARQLSGGASAILGLQAGPGLDLERFVGTFGLHFVVNFLVFRQAAGLGLFFLRTFLILFLGMFLLLLLYQCFDPRKRKICVKP